MLSYKQCVDWTAQVLLLLYEDKYSMTQKLLVKIRNNRTGQTLKNQDLTGSLIGTSKLHRKLAEDLAQQYADKHSARTGDSWSGFVVEYTPGVNKL